MQEIAHAQECTHSPREMDNHQRESPLNVRLDGKNNNPGKYLSLSSPLPPQQMDAVLNFIFGAHHAKTVEQPALPSFHPDL
jgi:hypothetical protein